MVGGMSAGGATTVQVNMPMEFVMEDRSSDGMALDPQALQKGMEQQMRSIAEKVVADSWRPGGMSFRQSIGRG